MALLMSQLSWQCQEWNPNVHKANSGHSPLSYNSSAYGVIDADHAFLIEKFVIEKYQEQW